MSTQVEEDNQKPRLPILTLLIMAAVAALAVAAWDPFMSQAKHGSDKGMERLRQATGSIEDAARATASRP